MNADHQPERIGTQPDMMMNISRVTGMMNASADNFIDDSKMLELLQQDNTEGLFQEIDMGQVDDEDKQYFMVDKDTGKVYGDIRNERDSI